MCSHSPVYSAAVNLGLKEIKQDMPAMGPQVRRYGLHCTLPPSHTETTATTGTCVNRVTRHNRLELQLRSLYSLMLATRRAYHVALTGTNQHWHRQSKASDNRLLIQGQLYYCPHSFSLSLLHVFFVILFCCDIAVSTTVVVLSLFHPRMCFKPSVFNLFLSWFSTTSSVHLIQFYDQL